MKVLRRTFEAAKHPAGSPERARLNLCAVTSEYLPGNRYVVQEPFLMSDGTLHPTQPFTYMGFRTKQAATEYASTANQMIRRKRRLEIQASTPAPV